MSIPEDIYHLPLLWDATGRSLDKSGEFRSAEERQWVADSAAALPELPDRAATLGTMGPTGVALPVFYRERNDNELEPAICQTFARNEADPSEASKADGVMPHQ